MKRVFLVRLFGIGAVVALGCFILWLIFVFTPVAIVEVRYEYKRMLQEVFHTTSLRGVFIPEFRFNIVMKSAHSKAGIVIPAIYVDEPIVFNVDPNDSKAYMEALKHGIAHASGTALPDAGNLGYYFAHSSTPEFVQQYNAVFYLLGKLKTGDEIDLWRDEKQYKYTVTKIQMTQPTDLSFLHADYDKETIVLQTCWPPGTSFQRLLVFGERITSR